MSDFLEPAAVPSELADLVIPQGETAYYPLRPGNAVDLQIDGVVAYGFIIVRSSCVVAF